MAFRSSFKLSTNQREIHYVRYFLKVTIVGIDRSSMNESSMQKLKQEKREREMTETKATPTIN